MTERRYSDESYKGHEIRVIAQRFEIDGGWTIEIYIQTSEGTHLPAIRDNDHSFQDLDIAFSTGSEIGRKVVDSN